MQHSTLIWCATASSSVWEGKDLTGVYTPISSTVSPKAPLDYCLTYGHLKVCICACLLPMSWSTVWCLGWMEAQQSPAQVWSSPAAVRARRSPYASYARQPQALKTEIGTWVVLCPCNSSVSLGSVPLPPPTGCHPAGRAEVESERPLSEVTRANTCFS